MRAQDVDRRQHAFCALHHFHHASLRSAEKHQGAPEDAL
jgi:hypothetical protein